jgi:hypothetical protein
MLTLDILESARKNYANNLNKNNGKRGLISNEKGVVII